MSFTHFDVEFTKDGNVFDNAQVDAVLTSLPNFTDLLVVSHGWNNDMQEARLLYENFFKSVDQLLDIKAVEGLAERKFGVIRLFWPSKKFADEDLLPGGGAASAIRQSDDSLIVFLERMKSDPARLGGPGKTDKHVPNKKRVTAINAAQALVPKLETDKSARSKFVTLLRSIQDPSFAHTDDGSKEFFALKPEELFEAFSDGVAPLSASAEFGGARAVVGSARPAHGGDAAIADMVSGIKAAARRIANFATYNEMKQRAGLVGSSGVAPLIGRIRDRKKDIKVHFVGHSFGGRLVTAAANALPKGTPSVSVSLLQAAFSHNGLATKFDDKHDGQFSALVAEKRASGPIIITHTKNDRAVGVAYPLASRISLDQASALGDENDPYGGMGRNGAQKMGPETIAGTLLRPGQQYAFVSGQVYNLNADDIITDHGDVTNESVAYAVLNAVKAI
ncbi:hypothetical protein EKL30_17310 [Candidimonas sp. SYP-B2681]|uniref:hypothetical protein n=1 Tax=Candidimonas sp. SYP-B2681 TaxID=2497686 RepID=UPI000F86FA26|nr:hypothetical protein [Candidimonas sp. SYP-B2681]RTZ40011.1 hypothetical protein EKL30_17310 [Candidimonas sp. SYP-B2681]